MTQLSRIVRGNDFSMDISAITPQYTVDGTIWEDFDLTVCTNICVNLICPKDQVVIPLDWHIKEGTDNIITADVEGKWLHSGTVYALEITGLDAEGRAWRYKNKSVFSIVDATSQAALTPDLMTDPLEVNATIGLTVKVLPVQGPQGTQGTQGNVGPQGPANGPQGEQGMQGDQGEQGMQGNQGEQGPQGNQGIQGIRGRMGMQGDQGVQGDQGDIGKKGPQGEQGNQGDIGEKGPQGLQGFEGEKGVQGAQGDQGVQGAQGNQGEQGDQGYQGVQGAMGIVDPSMFEDYATIEYVDNSIESVETTKIDIVAQLPAELEEDHIYLVSPPIDLDDGPQGAQGDQGVQGAAGAQGTQGEKGTDGIIGQDGAQGAQGAQGDAGTDGVQGPQGEKGTDGIIGQDGPQGVQGEKGTDGAQGPQGVQGDAGTDGVQGPQGTQGETGPSVQSNWFETDPTSLSYIKNKPIVEHDYANEYLTFESLEDSNEITFKASSSSYTKTIEVSLDAGATWTSYTSSTSGTTLGTIDKGRTMLLRGTNEHYGNGSYNAPNSFGSSKKFIIYGNAMSLINKDTFRTLTTLTGQYALGCLFKGCTHLISAENLTYTATTLTTGCYSNMFQDCTSLLYAPKKFPATNLTTTCYDQMFLGCTSLITAPVLPATTMKTMCYRSMFNGCSSLPVGPDLVATTLASSCYEAMFYGCQSLKSFKFLASSVTTNNTGNWLGNASNDGVIITSNTPPTFTDGDSGLRVGWSTHTEAEWEVARIYQLTSGTQGPQGNQGPAGDGSGVHDYANEYLTFESLEDSNVITFKATSGSITRVIEVSVDNGATWTSYTSSASSGTTLGTLNTGEKMLLRGNNAGYSNGSWQYPNSFGSSKKFIIYGNIMSIVNKTDFRSLVALTDQYAFCCLFKGATYLISAENLVLPATTLTTGCYSNMFQDCTSLISTVSELPATSVVQGCYDQMHLRCKSLAKCPKVLPATSLATVCYRHMFNGCQGMTEGPEIMALTTADRAMESMFEDSINLNFVKCRITQISPASAIGNWLKNTAVSGTLITSDTPPAYPTGSVSGIPTGWQSHTLSEWEVARIYNIPDTTGMVTSATQGLKIQIESSLPASTDANTLYLVTSENALYYGSTKIIQGTT